VAGGDRYQGGRVTSRRRQVNGVATLKDHVEATLGEYFDLLDGEHACDLYDVVMREVELPLLESVMRYVGNNQSQAADVLGLSRGTLRKKLKQHGIL
jgi:Fis family transcriptional regulator